MTSGANSVPVPTLDGVAIVDTFAEAFPMTAARVIVTAETPDWAEIAGPDDDGLRRRA